jgi:phosphatidylethanolamine-binding protein (PEBP) family uncharacterized protein
VLALLFSLLILFGVVLVRQFQEKERTDSFAITTSWTDGQVLSGAETCTNGVNPEVRVSRLPKGTESLALYLESENGKVDWLVSDVPSNVNLLTAGTKPEGTTYRNQQGNFGYVAPCKPGNYTLTVYALKDSFLGFNSGTDPREVLANLNRQKLAERTITVTVR